MDVWLVFSLGVLLGMFIGMALMLGVAFAASRNQDRKR